MSDLADKLAYTEQPQYGYITNEPSVVDETWMLGIPFLSGLASKGLKTIGGYLPYMNDVWQGRGLLFSNLLNTRKETRKLGENFVKENLANNPINTKYGKIEFKNKLANETDPRHMWQFPFARFNLSRAKNNIKVPNKKPNQKPDVDYFDNIEVNFLGRKYDYQIRNNKNNKLKDLYNIKDYRLLERDLEEIKNNPELYQKFNKLNNKGL